MKNPYSLFFIAILSALLFGCKPDPKSAQWDTQALTPMVSTRLDIADLLPDSLMTTADDGQVSLYFKNELAGLRPDEIMDPLNTEFRNTAKLQSIDLGNRIVTDFITLGELAQGGSFEGQFILYHHGDSIPSPAFNVRQKSFPYDATEFFESIDLISGEMILTFENQLPVTLTGIEFILENRITGDTVVNATVDTLKSGGRSTTTFSLANKTISGDLQVMLENFRSEGSDSLRVQIDTTDLLLIELELRNLVPEAATAIFPDQVISIDTTDTDELAVGNALLEKIRLSGGKIFMEASSTIEDQISLQYEIPSFTKDGAPLSFLETIDGAPPGGVSSSYTEVDITGYLADLTGRPYDNGVHNRFYTILISKIDSSGNLVHLSLEDSIFLRTGTVDVTASAGFGYLGKDTMTTSYSEAVNFFSFVDSGSFDLEDARLGITIENYIGAPVQLYLNELLARKGGNLLALSWDSLDQGIGIPAADLAGEQVLPGMRDILISKTSSNIDELIEVQPDSFITNLTGIINRETMNPDFGQFIFADSGIQASFFVEVPMHLSANGLALADTVPFDYSEFDEDEQLQQGTLKLIAENNFPMEAAAELIMLDEAGEVLGTLTSADRILAAETDDEGRARGTTRSVSDFPLDAEKLSLLRNTSSIMFRVILNSGAEKIRIYNTNFIDLTLSGDLTIRTQ